MELNAVKKTHFEGNRRSVPSLKQLASQKLQALFPPSGEEYFRMNSKALWSTFTENDVESNSSSDSSDENEAFDCTDEELERKVVLKSPEQEIFMREKNFLDHWEKVTKGDKRPCKSNHVLKNMLTDAVNEERLGQNGEAGDQRHLDDGNIENSDELDYSRKRVGDLINYFESIKFRPTAQYAENEEIEFGISSENVL